MTICVTYLSRKGQNTLVFDRVSRVDVPCSCLRSEVGTKMQTKRSRLNPANILTVFFTRGKGRDLTQSYDKSPYTHRKMQKATWQHKNVTISKWRLCFKVTNVGWCMSVDQSKLRANWLDHSHHILLGIFVFEFSDEEKKKEIWLIPITKAIFSTCTS